MCLHGINTEFSSSLNRFFFVGYSFHFYFYFTFYAVWPISLNLMKIIKNKMTPFQKTFFEWFSSCINGKTDDYLTRILIWIWEVIWQSGRSVAQEAKHRTRRTACRLRDLGQVLGLCPFVKRYGNTAGPWIMLFSSKSFYFIDDEML